MIKEIARGYTRGLVKSSIDLISVPFAYPTFKRRAKNKELYFQTAVKNEDNVAPFLGLASVVMPVGLVDLGVISFTAYELTQGKYFPALIIASTNVLSYEFQILRGKKIKTKSNINLERVVEDK